MDAGDIQRLINKGVDLDHLNTMSTLAQDYKAKVRLMARQKAKGQKGQSYVVGVDTVIPF